MTRPHASCEPERQLYRSKGTAMLGRGPVPGNGGMVLARAVALVPLETIIGVHARKLGHEAITRHLGHERGGSNRETFGITASDGARHTVEPRCLAAVDEHELLRTGQVCQRS